MSCITNFTREHWAVAGESGASIAWSCPLLHVAHSRRWCLLATADSPFEVLPEHAGGILHHLTQCEYTSSILMWIQVKKSHTYTHWFTCIHVIWETIPVYLKGNGFGDRNAISVGTNVTSEAVDLYRRKTKWGYVSCDRMWRILQ